MRKLLSLILALTLAILPAACIDPPKSPHATPPSTEPQMPVVEPSLTVSLRAPAENNGIELETRGIEDNALTADLFNGTNAAVTYGEAFTLDYSTDEAHWTPLIDKDQPFIEIAYELPAGESAKMTFRVPDPEFTFTSGYYRLTVPSLGLTADIIMEWTE